MDINDIKKSLFILILFILAVWSANFWPSIDNESLTIIIVDGVIDTGEYGDTYNFGEVDVFIDNDEEYLYVGLSSPGLGWVSIGFSPLDIHMGADFIFGAIVDGQAVISDEFGVDRFGHEPDLSLGGTSDIVSYAGDEVSGTVFEFKIELNSGDAYDVILESGESYSGIVAYHETDDDFQKKHTSRFSFAFSLHTHPFTH